MDLRITTLAERPGLFDAMWTMEDTWPVFVQHDPVGWSFIGRIATELPEYVLVATDTEGAVVAKGFSVPFALHTQGRDGVLPDRGWDRVMQWAFADLRRGTEPDTVSAIEITIVPTMLGRGLSGRMLAAMRENAKSRGFREVVAPVRPSGKPQEPASPMSEYAYRVRESDGLPVDPWLRVHVRAGGVIEKVAPASMTVSGSLDEWRTWTGLPFDTAGPVVVPGALVPVHCAPDRDHAVYVEPNVWVRHAL
ncbi:N-acetyltransferase [Streptomyces sp. VRA16 Mangrove soil]|uniref:N-acetyltransferase n=1 Tax=Streptomyces sp. VRA16 Mangrove soil TaxID=2817434 RepID=UPI001A9CF578|nr:N-acetyltransferase [Streptomyces sp. VRA16 Mangrove soil]MBO1336567.1 N-acetyltransferase [Streptomyces sp. VRA16 Mangrove soil]